MTLREKGAWLGVIVGALGWLLTLTVLARGGGYLVVVPRLAVVLPLAVVGTVTALGAFGVARRWVNGALWLGVVALFGVFWNFLVYWGHFGDGTWRLLLPLAKPTGIDFRDGLYQPALEFSTEVSGWPPLTLLLGRPFTLFSLSTGYAIQVVLLVLLALAATVLSALLAMRAVRAGGRRVTRVAAAEGDGGTSPDGAADPAFERDDEPQTKQGGGRSWSFFGLRVTAPQIALVAGVWLFTSYGFMYAVERGNIDLYALFFALLAVWLMVKLPRSPWWPTVALAISINLKLYPGVLLLLLFWRYRWKAVVPVVVTNVVLMLITGPGNVFNTLTGQSGIQSSLRPLWWGNHSASALANVLHQIHGWPSVPLYVVFLLVPLAIWALTMVVVIRRGWSDRTAVLAAAACVPVMSVVPAISHDYKLVLYVFPLAVLVAFVAVQTRRDLLAWSVVFGLTAWAMLQLSRSSLVIEPALWNSKWAMIVLVQALLLTVAWWSGRDARAFELEMAAGTNGRAAADAAEEVDAADAALAAGPAPAAAGGSPAPAAGWLARLAGTAALAAPDAPSEPAVASAVDAAGAAGPAGGGPALHWMNRRMLCIILLLLAVVLGANFWVGIVHSTFNDLNSGVGVPQHDFFQYYAGGHNWRLGVDPYLNHPGVPGVIEHPRHDKSDISGYIYPPTLLPLFGALSGTDYDTARGVWLALNVVAFALMMLVAALVSRGRRLEVLTAAVLLTMVSFGFFYHVHEGQIDMIVAALSISAFLLYPRWKGWPSAALLALAIATKVSPVVLVAVIALYYRDWRFVLKTAALVVAAAAVSLAFVDLSLYRAYLTDILPAISGSDPSLYNQTPLRFWWRYPTVVKIGSALGYAALLFLVWVVGRNSRRLPQAERRVDLRTERSAVLLLAVVLMLLFSPLAWQMAYVWVIVPLALVLTAPPPRGKEWAVLVIAVGAALLSMRMWPYRVLDMTNIIGGAVTALGLMLYYLPLDLEKLREGRTAAALDESEEAAD